MILHQVHNSIGNYNYNLVRYEGISWNYHFHKNFELIYVKKGRVFLTIDNKCETMTDNSFALVLPNQIHRIESDFNSLCHICVFSRDFVAEAAKITDGKRAKDFVFFCKDDVRDFFEENFIKNCEISVCMFKACMYAVFDEYLKNVTLIARNDKTDTLLCNILSYIQDHYKENISLKKIAEDLGYEYHYMSRLFSAMFKMNFCQFLNQYRFEHAKALLLKGNNDITSVCFASGFQSIRSFNRIFKQFSGTEPKNMLRSCVKIENSKT